VPLPWRNRTALIGLSLIATALAAPPAPAHEVPNDVIVQAWLVPDDGGIDLLLRAPLEAMRDVDFPVRGPGYIDLGNTDEYLRDAARIWLANFVRLYSDGRRLDGGDITHARVSLPSDRSFGSFDAALAHVTGEPLAAGTDLYRDQALLDVRIRYALPGAAASELSIDPDFAGLGLRTTTVLHFRPRPDVERVFEFSGSPGLVPLDPRWHHAFLRFVRLGIDHILGGVDHLLFVLCLIVPYRRVRPIVVMVTSFTVAHSITLISAAFGLTPSALWFPPLIEMLIAATIVYMAIENVVGAKWDRRWMIAFAFGLVHGFGFSFALAETLQFAGSHLVTSLLAFNLGVEIGQLLVIAIAIPLLNMLFRRAVAERTGVIVLSVLLAHSGWHWMTDRLAALSAYSFSWPTFDAVFAAALMRWAMLLIVIGLAAWVLFNVYTRFMARGTPSDMQGGGAL